MRPPRWSRRRSTATRAETSGSLAQFSAPRPIGTRSSRTRDSAGGFGCNMGPAAAATSVEPLQVCVYLQCQGDRDVEGLACQGDGPVETSPDGRPGCCGAGGAEVQDYGCSGFGSDDVNVWISVGSDEAVCVDYALEYSF